ncbi:MAG: PilZ domain-containing protein [Proteobacteria bacterium]|nr:PilZ domain-containing protein [Pseudomonadota bacterium]MBU4447342.1 PilZ domain-containing protein [Pseudomonadota bacterium]
MDKRRHPRLHLQLPIRFIVAQPETRDCQDGEGMLKDISCGGILFQVEPPLPVEPGQIREFSFFLVPEKAEQRDLAHFHAQGLVLRIDPPDPNSSAYGVAVQFLSALTKEDVTVKMTISPRPRGGPQVKPVRDEP